MKAIQSQREMARVGDSNLTAQGFLKTHAATLAGAGLYAKYDQSRAVISTSEWVRLMRKNNIRYDRTTRTKGNKSRPSESVAVMYQENGERSVKAGCYDANLLEREPVEVANRVVIAAAVHDELQGVHALGQLDGRNLECLPCLPSFGLWN